MRASKPQFDSSISPANYRIAIIAAKWNSEYNQQMLAAAKDALTKAGIKDIDIYEVPGAFEMPVFCKRLTQSLTRKYDAIICFATVFRGETVHFELVANESARGIMQVSLETGVPVMNGILACENEAQASARASIDHENKGAEVALSALVLLQELATLK